MDFMTDFLNRHINNTVRIFNIILGKSNIEINIMKKVAIKTNSNTFHDYILKL